MASGHWVYSRPGTSVSRPGSSLADINQSLQKRLLGLKGRSPEKGRDGRCRTPHKNRSCEDLSRTTTSHGTSRPGTQSLPSLNVTWSGANPFVAPQCPHESLVPLRGDVSSRQRRRRTRMPRLTLSPEDSSRFLLNKDEVEEQEKAEQLLPEEPFVDDYLERIYPTSYQTCPHSPISSKLLPQDTQRASKEQKARLKGKQQRLLERFGTTKRAFDEFLRTIREMKKLRAWKGNPDDLELPQKMFSDFLSQHFADVPQKEHETIFSFFDTDNSGSVSLSEFYAVVDAMSPVRCLADLRCRWIALGFSCCRAMESMAPRETWHQKRYNCQQLGQMLSKVGVWDWEEHVYIFMALASPNLQSTISLLEMHAALAAVSPVLLIEEWQHRLEQSFGAMNNAYDAIEGDMKAPLDLNKFVVMAGEMWDMSSNEAKRFFRLADVDGKQTMTRSKFLQILALVRPSLRLEHIRKKLRSHYNKMLNKIRSVNRQAPIDQLAKKIFLAFLQHKEMPTRRRSRVPDDYQRMFDELQLTSKDMSMLFALLDPKHSEQPEINCFWHMLMNFSPSVVLQDLSILSVRICTAISQEVKEAQKLPSWQARQLGLAQSFSPELQTWSDVVDGSRVFDVFAGLMPGQACRAAAARREATQIAPLAALSCCASGAGLLEDRFVRNSERELKQLLQEVFFERTEVQVSAVQLLELLEDSQGSRHTARGLSVAELLAAVGCMASDEAVVDTTSEGRLARAQLEARSQLEPFSTYALDLRAAVRERVKSVAALPKTLATGSILEPQSYVNTSCPVEVVPEEEKVMEAMQARLETVSLVKDKALRNLLQREVRDEEVQPVEATVPIAATVKRQPGEEAFESFYQRLEGLEATPHLPDEDLVERTRGYFHDCAGLVESQTALLSKKQNINSSHKSLRRAFSLRRSIKDVARDL